MLGRSTSEDIQEICRILWILKVHYRINKSITLVLILSLINAVHAHPDLFKITCQYYPPLDDEFFQVASHPQVSPPKPSRQISPFVPHMTPISFFSANHQYNIWGSVLHSPLTSSRFALNMFLNTLLPNTLNIWSLLTTK